MSRSFPVGSKSVRITVTLEDMDDIVVDKPGARKDYATELQRQMKEESVFTIEDDENQITHLVKTNLVQAINIEALEED